MVTQTEKADEDGDGDERVEEALMREVERCRREVAAEQGKVMTGEVAIERCA